MARGTETEKTLETRLKNAPGELDQIFALRNIFQYRVVNNDLPLAKKSFCSLVEGLYSMELHGKAGYSVKRVPYQKYAMNAAVLVGLVVLHEMMFGKKR